VKASARKRLYSVGGMAMAFSAVLTTVGIGGTSPAGATTAATAATATTAAVPKVPAPPAIQWSPCTGQPLKAYHAQCGYVSVPLDYSKPRGAHIRIAVSRIEHTSSKADYQGDILTNPGGPGGSGLALNPYLIEPLKSEGFGAAAADYDWIGFDPRGVGSSVPAITCIPDYFGPDRPNYDPQTDQLLDYWLSESQSYAQACDDQSAEQSALLHNMTTVDVAMDMDSIRQALGQSQITYYGFSYGTDLGQVYSTLFPTHVRRLILDSNVDPLRDGYQDFNLDQDGPFNRNGDIWFAWLAKYDDVYHLGSTETAVQDLYYATQEQLANDPAAGIVGPDEWNDIFLEAGYYEQTWLQLGQAFSEWVNKPDAAAAKNLVNLYEETDTPGNDNEFAVYLSVLCTDSQWPLNWSVWNHNVSAINEKAPFETWDNAWFNAPCIFWSAPSSTQFQVNGSGISSALLIDETLDAATPFQGSEVVRQLFPNSVLLAEPGGTSHADSLSGDLCVDGTIAAYLESGKLPKRNPNAKWDKTCAPLPPPVPSGGGTQKAAREPPTFEGNRLATVAGDMP
jgi:pimeloyl-ACP methyl ester carboxylesterase